MLQPHLPSAQSLAPSRTSYTSSLTTSIPSLSHMSSFDLSSPSNLSASLHTTHNLEPFRSDQPDAVRAASESIDILALDLVLSTHVLSPDPILPPSPLDHDDELERATQALSISGRDDALTDHAPALHFSFFKPVLKAEASQRGVASLGGDATACSLASQWIVGEDPADYRHVDLRTPDHAGSSRHGASASQAAAVSQRLLSQSQRPPVLQSSQPSTYYPPLSQSQRPPVLQLSQPPPSSQRRPHSSQRFSQAISQTLPTFKFTSFPPASSEPLLPPLTSSQFSHPPSSSQPPPSSQYPSTSQHPYPSQSQPSSQPVGIPSSPIKRRFPPSASYNAGESLPLPQRARANHVASSPYIGGARPMIDYSSQDHGSGFASTQVMPGPFGGRQNLASTNSSGGIGGKAKKGPKKRIGGF